jgi:hypothetical protein
MSKLLASWFVLIAFTTTSNNGLLHQMSADAFLMPPQQRLLVQSLPSFKDTIVGKSPWMTHRENAKAMPTQPPFCCMTIKSPREKIRAIGYLLRQRLDTAKAAGVAQPKTALFQNNRSVLILYSRIGFLGHSGLLLVSTVLVVMVKQLWKTLQQQRAQSQSQSLSQTNAHSKDDIDTDTVASAGVMDRCPWPFIFTHDPIQGLKDTPTWIVVVWVALWRLLKVGNKAKLV